MSFPIRYVCCSVCGDASVGVAEWLSADLLDGRAAFCDSCCCSGSLHSEVEDDYAFVWFTPSGPIHDPSDSDP